MIGKIKIQVVQHQVSEVIMKTMFETTYEAPQEDDQCQLESS